MSVSVLSCLCIRIRFCLWIELQIVHVFAVRRFFAQQQQVIEIAFKLGENTPSHPRVVLVPRLVSRPLYRVAVVDKRKVLLIRVVLRLSRCAAKDAAAEMVGRLLFGRRNLRRGRRAVGRKLAWNLLSTLERVHRVRRRVRMRPPGTGSQTAASLLQRGVVHGLDELDCGSGSGGGGGVGGVNLVVCVVG